MEDRPSSRGPGQKPRRVVSSSILEDMREMQLLDEPEMEALGEEEEQVVDVDDDDLPMWAQRIAFSRETLGRGHALLVALLPADLLALLPRTPERAELLHALSSGQLLCVAYNIGVRRSRKPWGFIVKDAIHDIAALEAQAADSEQDGEKGRRAWTFRRTDNLRLWAAALKLRYMLPIAAPPRPASSLKPSSADTTPLTSPSPSLVRFPTLNVEPPVMFEARVIAHKDGGWEDMLEQVFSRWVEAVVNERRGHEVGMS
ncbi:hypothetical protein EWM64_g5330 [Hericium alpestre]|uniref:Uncharacterized protein n=1 Tax=Hericium alpestre TaxID=135208 RepID=A0A4Y9ZUW3_9AGAM|nr:hypothetical protein EWM64_g5330 [Hericium alpestre]